MLINTFCHIPHISLRREKRIWDAGLHSWNALTDGIKLPLTRINQETVHRYLKESQEHLGADNPFYFAETLPASLQWRLFPEFRHKIAYLDIETTGLSPGLNSVTTIALYDGRQIFTYVQGQNLNNFSDDIRRYEILVTYNGKCFDMPFIEHSLGIRLEQIHLDLRFILRSLGYRGGLKGCEKQMGVKRQGLEDVDGYFAVLLWNEYKRRRNDKALETLLCYNIHDVVNLEALLVMAYNLKLKGSPFEQSHLISLPNPPDISFEADQEIIETIRSRLGAFA